MGGWPFDQEKSGTTQAGLGKAEKEKRSFRSVGLEMLSPTMLPQMYKKFR
jgi:hypothetical protein